MCPFFPSHSHLSYRDICVERICLEQSTLCLFSILISIFHIISVDTLSICVKVLCLFFSPFRSIFQINNAATRKIKNQLCGQQSIQRTILFKSSGIWKIRITQKSGAKQALQKPVTVSHQGCFRIGSRWTSTNN